MTSTQAALATLLFTDIVGSTELLQRSGDEDAQRIFKAHHRLLRDAVAANGGHEVKWLGDGLMVAFPSAADAVRCAIAMQQASRRGAVAERMDIRVGLNVGDTLRDETDYFGTPVVVAKRLCDRAAAGQIMCSSLVAGLLAGRQAFSFADIGALDLKGIAAPVTACEVLYDREEPGAFLAHTPFVGRGGELARLRQKLDEARAGHGSLVMLAGDPGIGKTRMSEEFAEHARGAGATVLWGRCFEGEWTPPYGPFGDAIGEYVRAVEPAALRDSLGSGAGVIARIVPTIGEIITGLDEPAPLQPDEERFRLLDAVAQFLIAISSRAPVLLVLDDMHWADRGTITMLSHVARFISKHSMLILGAYRDVDLDRQHPLADALSALRRETEYERILLKGLEPGEVGTLISTIGEQEANPALVQAISDETEGNPFFIREVLLHLVEDGKLYREGGEWRSTAQSIADLGIPEGVRQVISRRLSRLSATANKLLTAASGFDGAFRFDIAAEAAGLEEAEGLDALDEALDAQVVRPTGEPDAYAFTHALIRSTLYTEMNPSRQVRLHRHIAESMERVFGDRTSEHAPQLAQQFHRSAALPGAERGVGHALVAADRAEASGAWDESVTMLRIALDLAPSADARRRRIEGRLGLALAWSLQFDEALETMLRAGEALAATEGDEAAANYYADAASACSGAGFDRGYWRLAPLGLAKVRDRHDFAWAVLTYYELQRREAEASDKPGILTDSPDRAELIAALPGLIIRYRDDPDRGVRIVNLNQQILAFTGAFKTRAAIIAGIADADDADLGFARTMYDMFWVGRFRSALESWKEFSAQAYREGRIAGAVTGFAFLSRLYCALGYRPDAEAAFVRAQELASRLDRPSTSTLQVIAADDELRELTNEGWNDAVSTFATLATAPIAENAWAQGPIYAGVARTFARIGNVDAAAGMIALALPTIERYEGSTANYSRMVCTAAEALWVANRTEHIDAIEQALREKVVAPDFRYPMTDGRLALAQVSALQGRHEEASRWFAESRRVTEETEHRPMRAIADYDEALMYVRRGAGGDAAHARPLLEASIPQFREIDMTGWLRDAEELVARV
jgi:class 3 adenylate cyclase